MGSVLPSGMASVGSLNFAISDCSGDDQLVLDAYTNAMRSPRHRNDAFTVAVRAWRDHHPDASPEEAAPAVATILCNKI